MAQGKIQCEHDAEFSSFISAGNVLSGLERQCFKKGLASEVTSS